MVPRIKTSTYVRMLAEVFPEIRGQKPGEIQTAELPELRNLVVIDNVEEAREDLAKLHIKSMVDWREVLMWRNDARESRILQEIMASLRNDDVTNLQFTRFVFALMRSHIDGTFI